MIKRLIVLVVGLWLTTASAAEPPTVLVLGDSLSSGFGLSSGQGWVSLLKQRLQQRGYPHRVINASITGETTDGGVTRIKPLLARYYPRILILELGGNDGLRAFPPYTVHANLSEIIRAAQQNGTGVLLAGLRMPPNYGPAYTKKFEAIYPELANQYKVTLVPFFLQGVATVPGMMQTDAIHPSAQAQPVLLENVWPYLESLL